MKRWIVLAAAPWLLLGCGSNPQPHQVWRAGQVDRFEVVSTADAYNGATPAGAAGPYTVVTGIVHGKLDPRHPDNAGIVDLDKAPMDADGKVRYTTDVVILRPKSATHARRVLFYDVVNRGNKLAQNRFIGGGALKDGAAPAANFASILQRGYTVVWSGWQGDVAQSGNGAAAALGTVFPLARNADGSAITGLSREEFIADAAGTPDIPLNYPPASLTDRSEVIFTARPSYYNAAGQQTYASPSAAVTTWDYVTHANGSVSVRFTAPATVPDAQGGSVPTDAGTVYNFTYRAKDPKVMGIGFAAVRDLVGFLKNDATDAQGNANPVADLKSAACASGVNCPANPATHFDVALGEGVSQSGRFLRDFLYQGFNKDSAGKPVFDGMLSLIPAARRTWINARFAQPGRWSKQHEDHFMLGDQFPFAYNVTTDPVSGATDGLLRSCLQTSTCPKIMQADGSYEWWGGRASLVVTDGRARDLALPDNVRYYLVLGTGHGGGAGVTTGVVTQPAAGSTCTFANSPVAMAPVERALVKALEDWTVQNTPPPASSHPTVAAGTAVLPTAAATGFPNLAAISVPNGAAATPLALRVALGKISQVFVTDYSTAAPAVDVAKAYTLLVPRVDANGNELGGLRMPEVAVPLATYTGWNVRSAGHAAGENCPSSGSAIPLAVGASTKAAGDPRSTLAGLYGGRADYLARFGAAADALVAGGYFGSVDAANAKAGAASVSTLLIPAP
ncbi:alpha/beta hydrolase domain-containing protein [Pseudorhodoferax sp. Leaf274]|uniref:alpha/beta hydrolase domain-containing protein n=1 Tax=Pseudorhodoferax sp. Leaf274 TaxID=1736318 RepID=UPI000703AE41|nr:alpha/beta hydrolase domain-containing protein [Pseudorhodoferax sp. Leaf274]KQP49599.1 peptidase [Pseudorhodoferax sp. Leaf274]